MDPGPLFYIYILPSTASTVYFLQALFTYCKVQTNIFFHTIRLILCFQQTSEIDNLTASWGKYLGCVVCRFHIAAGAGSAPCQKPVSNNLHKWFLSPTSRLNFGFILRENLLLCSSHLPLGVPNWFVNTAPSGHNIANSSIALRPIYRS
jgi:hypothetical protein